MGLSIKNDLTEAKIRRLAEARKLSMTAAVTLAVENELKRTNITDADWEQRWEDIAKIQARSRVLPVLDNRSDDEILGYGDDGIPG